MQHEITRRNAIRGAAGLAGAATIGSLGLLAASPATAASVSISGTTVSTDDGDLSFVDLDLGDYFATWRNFDVPVAAVAYHDVLELLDDSGGVVASHTLFDQRGVDAQPVQLKNISSKGDGSDGWGGPGEYASEDPDTYVRATGPTTSGFVHADVLWRLLTDDSADTGHSIEDPAVLGEGDWPTLDNPDDGTTKDHTLRMTKEVYLYALDPTGTGVSLTADDGSTTVYLMGADDGTREKVQATPQFTISVENEASTSSPSGSGTTSGG